jgi:hypothetical protein
MLRQTGDDRRKDIFFPVDLRQGYSRPESAAGHWKIPSETLF